MTALDRKLLRDLWRVRGQALSIGLVVACGVAMLVMMSGLVVSLEETRDAYYERYRFADLFAPVKRAPRDLLRRLESVPGVAIAVGRVNAGALLDLADEPVPIRARAVSLPDFGEAELNAIHLVRGRRPDPARPEEIVLLADFARARAIGLGDFVNATLYGVRQRFQVVGIAQAPEFLYAVAPGELAPDDSRFAVLWLSESALAAAFDLDGAFNEALLQLDRNGNPQAVLTAVDAILESSGGLGAYDRQDQLSNRFVSEEIQGLKASSTSVPPIFLGVAAFLLYIVMSRMIQTEREQIGLLKAFGHSDLEIGAHYLKFVLAIAVLGVLLGVGGGIAGGQAMAQLYQHYFKFPFLVFQLPAQSLISAVGISLFAAAAGGLIVIRRVFLLSPAVAMRPPAPPRFARAGPMLAAFQRHLDQPSRMIVRQLVRTPGRTLLGITGIATGMALSVAMLALLDSFTRSVEVSFSVVDRSHMTVVFVEPRGRSALHELERLPGVLRAEAIRSVPVLLRHGAHRYRGSVNGLVAAPALYRALNADYQPITIRQEGIVLSEPLAKELQIKAGQRLRIEVQEGRRPIIELPVIAVARSLVGAPAYFELNALNRALGEDWRMSGVYLTIDPQQSRTLYAAIKNLPAVAGVSRKADARAAFEKLLNEGAGAVRYVMATIAGLITFGIVYNSARIAFAERARDLSSLRVFGLTTGETAYVLLGELAVLVLLALPVGMALGYALAQGVAAAFSTDLYQIPAGVSLSAYAGGCSAVLIAATLSALIVKRDVDRLDIIAALKSRD